MRARKTDKAGSEAQGAELPAATAAIQLRQLRYFLAVFEELHFGHAAERLRIAQPPLSQSIRKLEEELGVRLFERTSRAVSPTEAGRVLAEHARQILTSLEVAVAEVRRAGGADAPLRIGCVPQLPVERLLRFLAALQEHDPELRTQVAHLPAPEQLLRLSHGELDLAIFHSGEREPDLSFEPLFAGEQMAAFLPRRHPLAKKEVLTPADLRGATLVIFPRAGNPALLAELEAQFRAGGYEFAEVVEAGGMTVRDVLVMVAEREALTLGPFSFKDDSVMDALKLHACWLEPPLSTPETVVAWKPNPPEQLGPVLSAVREVAKQIRARDR